MSPPRDAHDAISRLSELVMGELKGLRASLDQHREKIEKNLELHREKIDEHAAQDTLIQTETAHEIKELGGRLDRLVEYTREIETAIRGKDVLGSQSIAVQMNAIRDVALAASSKATANETQVALLNRAKEEREIEDGRARTAVKIAVVAALGSIVAAIVALVGATWRHP